jgi:metallo-beta-lactamase family protein
VTSQGPTLRSPVLTFLGAAGTVTGSRFLLDTPRARVLVDCGLFQGLKHLRLRNWEPFPVPADTIDAVALTHAHVDHIGYLPAIVRDGFAGRVHASDGTAALAGIVLPDCGHLQEEDAEYANRRGFSKHHPALPLYTQADADAAQERIDGHPFGDEVEMAPGVHVSFRPAGHILGSSVLHVRLADHDDRTVVFSGDLGRPRHPVLVPPSPIGRADVVVVESTYGNRRHDDRAGDEEFRRALHDTLTRGGTVLIPAFAVDRTEVVLIRLGELMREGLVPSVPVFVDSPMALRALEVYRSAIASGAEDVDPSLAGGADVFDPGGLVEVRDVEESKALAGIDYPSIIVSASGMATGGRVLHHLARLLPDRRNTVILPGYQAAGTRGRLLAEGAGEIKLLGRYVRVRAQVVPLGSFSIHADADELLAWVATADPPPEVVHVVHGEAESAAELRDRLEHELDLCASVPRHLERVRLD